MKSGSKTSPEIREELATQKMRAIARTPGRSERDGRVVDDLAHAGCSPSRMVREVLLGSAVDGTAYLADGATLEVPRGPCLMQPIDRSRVDIIWGDKGQHSAAVLVSEIKRAAGRGDFTLVR